MEPELSSLIDINRFISVLSDGSTDTGVTEEEMIYCRLLDKELKASTKFVDIILLENADLEGILNGIPESIKNVHDTKFKQNVGDKNLEEAQKEFQEKTIKDFSCLQFRWDSLGYQISDYFPGIFMFCCF